MSMQSAPGHEGLLLLLLVCSIGRGGQKHGDEGFIIVVSVGGGGMMGDGQGLEVRRATTESRESRHIETTTHDTRGDLDMA